MSGGGAAASPGGAYRQFNFIVHFGEEAVAGFADASGLDKAAAAEDSPAGTAFLTLSRGLGGSPFLGWLRAGGPSRELTVILLDEGRQPLMRWALTEARPHRFAPPSSPADRALAPLETVRLSYRTVAPDWRRSTSGPCGHAMPDPN